MDNEKNVNQSKNNNNDNLLRPPPPLPPPRLSSSSSSNSNSDSSIQQTRDNSHSSSTNAFLIPATASSLISSYSMPIKTTNKAITKMTKIPDNNQIYNLQMNENFCTNLNNNNNNISNNNCNNNTNDIDSQYILRDNDFIFSSKINESLNGVVEHNSNLISIKTNPIVNSSSIRTSSKEREIRNDNLNYSDLLNNSTNASITKPTSSSSSSSSAASLATTAVLNNQFNNNTNPVNNSSSASIVPSTPSTITTTKTTTTITTKKLVPLQTQIKIKKNINNSINTSSYLQTNTSNYNVALLQNSNYEMKNNNNENIKHIDLSDTSSSCSNSNSNGSLNVHATQLNHNQTKSDIQKPKLYELGMQPESASLNVPHYLNETSRQESSKDFYRRLAAVGLSSPSANNTPMKFNYTLHQQHQQSASLPRKEIFLKSANKDGTNSISNNSVPIRIERESNSTNCIATSVHYHCNPSDCNCHRYSAADIISFNIPPNASSSQALNTFGDGASSSILLSTFPSKTCHPKSVSAVKKLSNLKRSNCANRLKNNEKVKFSDIELRHLIIDDQNLIKNDNNDELDALTYDLEKDYDNDNFDDYENSFLNSIYVNKPLKQSMSTAELKKLPKKSFMKHSNTLNVLDLNLMRNSMVKNGYRNHLNKNNYEDYDDHNDDDADNDEINEDSDDHYYYFDKKEKRLRPLIHSRSRNRSTKKIYVDNCGNYYYNYCIRPASSSMPYQTAGQRYRKKIESSESDFECQSNYRKLYVDFSKDNKETIAKNNYKHQRSSNSNYNHRSNYRQKLRQKPTNSTDKANQHQSSSLKFSTSSNQKRVHQSTDDIHKMVSTSTNNCIYKNKEQSEYRDKSNTSNREKTEINYDNLRSIKINNRTPTLSPDALMPPLPSLPSMSEPIRESNSMTSLKSNSKQIEATSIALQSLEKLNLNKIKQQIINPNLPVDSDMIKSVAATANNYVKPISKAQLNRIMSKDQNDCGPATVYSKNYQDMLAENASFMDSPIHSLMSHHVHQRLLKQQNNKCRKNTDSLSGIKETFENTNLQPKIVDNEGKEILKVNATDLITIKLNDDLIQTEQMIQPNPDEQVFTYEYREQIEKPIDTKCNKSNSSKPPKFNKYQRLKIFYAILVTSIITYSSVYLLEMVTCLIKMDNTNLMVFKLSAFLLSFFYVLFIGSSCCQKDEQNKYFYNVFHVTTQDDCNKSNELQLAKTLLDSDNSDYLNKQNKNTYKIESNFYMILISLLLIYFWVLSTYLFSFLFSSSSSLNASYLILTQHSNFPNIMETISAVIGGIGVALFFRNIMLYLFEFDLYSKTNNDSNAEMDNLIQKKTSKLFTFKNILLKYFVALQIHWFLSISFFAYTIFITGENSANNLIGHVCLESIVNATKYKLCPMSLVTNEFFSWKNEILYRKSNTLSITTNQIQSNSILSLQSIFQAFDKKNETESSSPKNPNYSDDIYLIMISVSMINFFVSLIIPLAFIKTNKKFKTATRAFQNLESTTEQEKKSSNKSNNQSTSKLVMLHLMIPLVFFQGFSKTIFLCELNKLYVSCLNGINHLITLLSIYGFCSLASIIILAALMILFNYKRKILFLLAFIQQITLIVLLLFWNPAKSIEFKNYYIDHIFFLCLAVSDNLWLVHNIKTLVEKSYDLNKSTCVVLIYGYSMYCLGGFIGYGLSIYFCTLIKLNLTLLLLVLFSTVYTFSEFIFYLTKKV